MPFAHLEWLGAGEPGAGLFSHAESRRNDPLRDNSLNVVPDGPVVSKADLVDRVGRLFQGVLVAEGTRQLVDESLSGEGREVEVVFARLDRLLVPVNVQLIDGPGGVPDVVGAPYCDDNWSMSPSLLNAAKSR